VIGAAGASWNVVSDLRQLFAFHFMVNALLAGTIVAVTAGTIGWFMVLRQQTFAGHTLAVVGFPGAAGATWLGLSPSLGYFGACLATAVVIAAVPRPGEGIGFSEESAVVGTVQAFALACGFLFVSLYRGFLNGINALLFGNFLGVTDQEVLALLIVAVASLVALVALGRPLLFASIDGDVAAARGVPVQAISTAFLLLLAVAAAEASHITGSLLVFALLVMPAAAAQKMTARPGRSLAGSVAIAVLTTWLALAVAYFTVYPIGFWVTTFAFAAYLLAAGWRRVRS
jgi:zinc/manganese transport system permease protein